MHSNAKSIVAVTLGLALVASIATNLYLDGQNGNLANQLSTVNSHNTILAQSTSSLQSELGTQSTAITSLEGNLSTLSAKISILNDQITELQAGNSTSQKEIQALQTEVSQLENKSALLNQEVSLLGQFGGEKVGAFAVNYTLTVQPNSTVLFNEQVNEYNGTLVFTTTGSTCPDGAGTAANTNGEPGYTVLLNSRSLIPSGSLDAGTVVGASEWALYLENIGPTTVQCTGSLYYVYQVPTNSP